MRPLGTVLTSLQDLDIAPWQAVLLTSPRRLSSARALPYPHVWFRTPNTGGLPRYRSALDRTLVCVQTPQTLHHPLPEEATPAFALAPGVTPQHLLRTLATSRWAFVRLDNWTHAPCPQRTGFLAPDASYAPRMLSQILQALSPHIPVLVTRPTWEETLHDIGLIRLWDAYLQRLPFSDSVQQRIRASMTGVCPSCTIPLRAQRCEVCGGDWDVSRALLSPYPSTSPVSPAWPPHRPEGPRFARARK